MKTIKNVLVIIIIGISTQTISQSFAEIGSKWTYQWQERNYPYALHPYYLEVTGMDSINGKEVYVIEDKTRIEQDYWLDGSGKLLVYEENNVIYFYSPFNNRFNQLYDFNVSIGDTMVIEGLSHDAMTGKAMLEIIAEREEEVCGEKRKRWKVRNLPVYQNHVYYEIIEEIIEGVGGTSFLVPTFSLIEPFGSLRCYQNTVLNCEWVSDCDEVIIMSSTSQSKNQSIELFPNPSQGKFRIKLPEGKISQVNIFNVYGQSVDYILSGKQVEMIGNEKGIFTLIVSTENGQILTRKLLVN